MGLEVSRIFALAEGSFHIRNTKKATLGTRSKMSQKRTLKQKDECESDHHWHTWIQKQSMVYYLIPSCELEFIA